PDQRLHRTIEGGPVENEKLSESTERDRAAQVDGHEQRELGRGQIERCEGGAVEARDRPRGAAEPSARALHLDAGGQGGEQLGPRGRHENDVYASIGALSRSRALTPRKGAYTP